MQNKYPKRLNVMRVHKILLACLLIFSAFHPAFAQVSGTVEEVPFVPTPMEVVDRMLEFGAVKKGDIIDQPEAVLERLKPAV